MAQDYTEIVVILDRSGSMQAARADHEGGLKSFVEDQKALAGKVNFTLVQFDTQDSCEVVYDGVPIENVKEITIVPRGGTPLLDAIGGSLAHVEKRIGNAKPDQIVVMVITDGQENASREWTRANVRKRIKELEKLGFWKFLFLGAGIDAFGEAGSLGVALASTINTMQSGVGLRRAYAATSCNVVANRAAVADGLDAGTYDRNSNKLDYAFTDAQRTTAMAEGEDENGTLHGGRNFAADTEGKGRGRRGGGRRGTAGGGDGS